MFEDGAVDATDVGLAADVASAAHALLDRVRDDAAALGAAAVDGLPGISVHAGSAATPDAGTWLVDLLSALSGLSSAVEAVSARAAVELDRVRRAQEAEQGVPPARRGRGVGAEVGLARRESGTRGRSFLGFGKVLCTEMPHTMRRLAAGDLSPWRAVLLAKESATLTLEDRVRLDEELCADPQVLAGMGDRAVAAAARAWACREDPASIVERRSRAESERRVSLRPAPDTMAYLTALVPVAEGVAAFAALSKHADSARSEGDPRSRGQVMADALVARVTGQAEGASPGVLVNLVMTDSALFTSHDAEPATLPGYGPVPAAAAREMVDRASNDAAAWVRRLYMAPRSGELVSMDSKRRKAPRGLAEFVRLRDGDTCRVPWCDAPARHIDHVVGVAEGGLTTDCNSQAGCELHNYAKQAPGWRSEPVGQARDPAQERDPAEDERHVVATRTPTGHVYLSGSPRLPGSTTRQHDDREHDDREQVPPILPSTASVRSGPHVDYSEGEETFLKWVRAVA
ncbi:HNH endonuclease [Pseudactinotalea terrae]|uniref:HNH endonuclease n=1 Tax=Pseudactinotalea terrae TaxID=1743262 RepID=UPI00188331AA|nr:HNH endonuclease [Pseudactinotalea terrae]